MLELPHITVSSNKLVLGANNLKDNVPQLYDMDFNQAFEQPLTVDAHFLTYRIYGPEVLEKWNRRVNKIALPKVRAAGGEIKATMLVLDYDNPKHQAWSDGHDLGDFLQRLEALAETWPLAWQWSLLYTTRGGARLVYVYDEPIDVEISECKHRWLCREFCERGIEIEEGSSDWTRFYRLPQVTRDGVQTWEEDYYLQLPEYQNRLDAEQIPSLNKIDIKHEYADIEPVTDDMPDDDQADMLLQSLNQATGRYVKSEWQKKAQARLKGRECYDCLFKDAPLADSGKRDNTLQAYVGQATSLLIHLEGTTPAHIHALFLSAVLQLEPDAGTPDWRRNLWSKVCRLWEQETAKKKAAELKAEAEAEVAVDLCYRVLSGMREWCVVPDLHGSDEEGLKWLSQRMLVSHGGNYFVMTPSGWYDSHQLQINQVIPRLRILGMDKLITTQVPKEDGTGWRDVPITSIINRHATIVKSIVAKPCIRGGLVEDMDGPNATMVVCSYRRNEKLVPKYDADVDMWLRKLFGENYEAAVHWISWALAFDEGPICALSLSGASGAGKKMLTIALTECLEMPAQATASDLVGNNQYGLMDSPFLVVNEGWPESRGGRHPADEFRSLVSGDPLRIERKYMAPVMASNPVRIIFTANNTNVVQRLTGNRDLSPDDREALAIRLLHFNIDHTSVDWLRIKGGVAFTGAMGRRWIHGDSGEPSDFVVARHFLYLYRNRRKPVGARLLVEGNSNNEIMFQMRTQSGTAPLVIECTIQLLNAHARMKREGIAVHDGRIFILTSEVLSYFREFMSQKTHSRLTAGQIANVFKSLVVKEPDSATVLECRQQLGRRRWYELDPVVLNRTAQNDGWSCPTLEEIIKVQSGIPFSDMKRRTA